MLTLDDLRACGLTYSAVKVRVARGVLHPLYRGVFAWGHHNMPIKAHRSGSIERVIVQRIPVTPRLRTVGDLARSEDDETVKRALRAAKFSATELARLPPAILALGAVPTRGPVEDSAYDVVVRSGLRAPREVGAPFRLPSGTIYPDLRWPELRLIVEVDSAEWHDDPLAQLADRERQAELEAVGERVLRVRKAELTQPRFLARLRAAGVPTSGAQPDTCARPAGGPSCA